MSISKEHGANAKRQPIPQQVRESANLLLTAATEVQLVKQHLFFPESISSKEFVNKGLTPENELLVSRALDPLCVTKPQSKAPIPPDVTLASWQKKELQGDLSYESFVRLVDRDFKIEEQDSTVKHIFYKEFIVRLWEKYSFLVPAHDDMQDNNRITFFRQAMSEMQTYGVDRWKQAYDLISQSKAQDITPKNLDIVTTQANMCFTQKEQKNNPLYEYMQSSITQARKRLQDIAQTAQDQNSEMTYKMAVETFRTDFETSYSYLMSLIPPEERKWYDGSAKMILDLAISMRSVLPGVANAEVLARLWWQLRLGEKRSAKLVGTLEREVPDFVRTNAIERYKNHLYDNCLQGEAGSYEYTEKVIIPNAANPGAFVERLVQTLITHHIPKDQKAISFTLLSGESHIRTIIVDYHEGISTGEIADNIQTALAQSRWEPIDLSDDERAEMSYVAQRVTDRKKDKRFQNYMKGDYLIQLTGNTSDTRDVHSLFKVGDRQVAIRVGLSDPNEIDLTLRYSHPYFDGGPAITHGSFLIEDLKQSPLTESMFDIFKDQVDSIHTQLQRNIMTAATQSESIHPLIEARADYVDPHMYSKVKKGDTFLMSPSEMRALVIGSAIGVNTLQFLTPGEKESLFYVDNPNTDNILPVVMGIKGILEEDTEKREKAIRAYRSAVARKHDVALMGGIAGTKEPFLGQLGKGVNPHITAMLTHSPMMVSIVKARDGGEFTTAFSSAYLPSIDLNNPPTSGGIIGINLANNRYTVRMMPAHAQKEIAKAALECAPGATSEESQTMVKKEFTRLLKDWHSLVGGKNNGKGISYQTYRESLRKAVIFLEENQFAGDDSNEMSEGYITSRMNEIQKKLNEALKKAAKSVFNQDAINAAYNTAYSTLTA